MANQFTRHLFRTIYYCRTVQKGQVSYQRFVSSIITRFQSHRSKSEKVGGEVSKESSDILQASTRSTLQKKADYDSGLDKNCSSDEDVSDSKWKLDPAWLTKVIEPAVQLCRWALPTGIGDGSKSPPSSRSMAEIIASIQRSKVGIEDWSLSDLTVGLYLIYLRQASLNPFDDVKGVQVSSESTVQDLIYHTELAKAAYKDNIPALARNSMLRENNILKFVKNSSVMRPGYYIGVDPRKKLVILGIRGTHTVYDLITDIVSSSDGEVTFEGYSTHFGTAEAARWFLRHEISTIRKLLEQHKGFRLRLVGHSLGGATASLLAVMLRRQSTSELGFSPEIISAIGYATPPCVSKELAESCSGFVTTVVMQDDIIPRLSVASLARLRNEIVQTDWMSVVEKEDWKSVIGLVTNAKQVVSVVQDVARKLTDYAQFMNKNESSKNISRKGSPSDPIVPQSSESGPENEDGSRKTAGGAANGLQNTKASVKVPEELFVPGSVYYLKRNVDSYTDANDGRSREYFTLWKRNPAEHFQRIVLSSNLISDHKCDNHYYALRDALKGFPSSNEKEEIFR